MNRPTLAVLVALLIPIGVRAQTPTGARQPVFAVDSGPWRPVLEYLIQSLAGEILRASTDTASSGWRIVLPSTSPESQRFRTHLLRALGGRDPRPGDATLDDLMVDTMRVSGDTVRVRISRTHTRQCPNGGDTGFGNRDEVNTVRFGGSAWSVARTTGILHGDRVSCK